MGVLRLLRFCETGLTTATFDVTGDLLPANEVSNAENRPNKDSCRQILA